MGKIISQTVSGLINGVSQRPNRARHPTQAIEQINGFSHRTRGLMKRPRTEPGVFLTGEPLDADSVYMVPLNRDTDERYMGIVTPGAIRVFDTLTGVEQVVETPEGTDYLFGTAGYRHVTVGDTTYIVNRGVITRVDPDVLSDDPPEPQALVYVRQAEHSTEYNVTVDTYTATFTTAATGSTLEDTVTIAAELRADLAAELTGFTVLQFGSVLYIANEEDFELSVSDGLGDQGLRAIKGSVQRVEDLPLRALDGFLIEVVGDPGTRTDNFWVKFDSLGNPNEDGVWREVAKPGTRIALDPHTMPHELVYGGAFLSNLRAAGGIAEDFTHDLFDNQARHQLSFEPKLFPAGMSVVVTLDLTDQFSWTVPDDWGPTTGVVVAEMLTGLIDASEDYNAEIVSTGTIEITRVDTEPFVLGVLMDWDSSTQLFLGGDLVPAEWLPINAFVGLTLRNLTDGSEGTITKNGSHTIEVEELTGGTNNEFTEGDQVEITGIGTYFIFRPVAWKHREAGENESNPFPSFVDRALDTVFYARGRLGMTSGSRVVMSAAGEPERLFRQTIRSFLPGDPIDFISALRVVPNFHDAFEWDGQPWLWADSGQCLLKGEPVLSPATVGISLVTEYESSAEASPVVAGDRIFFLRQKENADGLFTQVMEYRTRPFQERPSARDVTREVPAYIEGIPRQVVADDSLGLAVVLVDAVGHENRLYVYSYVQDEQARDIQSSWSKWDICPDVEIHALALFAGSLHILASYPFGLRLARIPLEPLV